MSWSIIESLLDYKFGKYLISKKISMRRIKSLKRYQISTILEILELLDEIDSDLYGDLNAIRKDRNSIIHPKNEDSAQYEITEKAFYIANMMVGEWIYQLNIIDSDNL